MVYYWVHNNFGLLSGNSSWRSSIFADFNPVASLKRAKLSDSSCYRAEKNSLVLSQFSISIILVVGTLSYFQQLFAATAIGFQERPQNGD